MIQTTPVPPETPAERDAPQALIVDDDARFGEQLQRSLARRGWQARHAIDGATALKIAAAQPIDGVILDLKLEYESGLQLIEPLRQRLPGARIILLTGYASIATAVEAIKRGADDYLPKPVDLTRLLAALSESPSCEDDADPADESSADAHDAEALTPLRRLEWEHIQQALQQSQGNISAAARRLGMHRRSLQRKLAKRPVKGLD